MVHNFNIFQFFFLNLATERIKELATPNVRKKLEDTDVKENPFSVLPRALKAICTKRVKELAKPIERD